MRRILILLLAAAVLAAGGARLASGGGGASSEDAGGRGRVVRVVDGDTIRVQLGGREERVRYIGVDTPESVKPDAPVECFGVRAASANERLVAGEDVTLEVGVEARDRYGRLLAYVHRARDGRFINEALIADGFARPLAIPPNTRFADRFAALARRARAEGRGLWRSCAAG